MKSKIFPYPFLLFFILFLTNCRTNQQVEPRTIDEAELRICPEFQDLVKTIKGTPLKEYSDYEKKRWAGIDKLSTIEQTALIEKIKKENAEVAQLRLKIREQQRVLDKNKPDANASEIEVKKFNAKIAQIEIDMYNSSSIIDKEFKDVLITTCQKAEAQYQAVSLKTQTLIRTYPSLQTTHNMMFKRVLREEIGRKNY